MKVARLPHPAVESAGRNVGNRSERCCTRADHPPSDHTDTDTEREGVRVTLHTQTAGFTSSGKPHPAAMPERKN